MYSLAHGALGIQNNQAQKQSLSPNDKLLHQMEHIMTILIVSKQFTVNIGFMIQDS